MWRLIYRNFEGKASTKEETMNGKKGEKLGRDTGIPYGIQFLKTKDWKAWMGREFKSVKYRSKGKLPIKNTMACYKVVFPMDTVDFQHLVNQTTIIFQP